MDLAPVDFLAGLGGINALPNPAREQSDALGLQQQQMGLRTTSLQQQALVSELQQRQAAQQRQQQFQTDVVALGEDPSPNAIAQTIRKYPEFAKQLQDSHQIQDEAKRNSDFQQQSQIYAAANGGRYDLAAQLLKAHRDASVKAGEPADPTDDAIITALESGDPKEQKNALSMIGLHVAAINPDQYEKVFGKPAEPYTLGEGQTRFAPDGSVIASVAPKAKEPHYYTLKDANGVEHEFADYGDSPQSAPQGGGGQASGGGASGSGALSVRLNNPGAIRDNPANKWQGQVGSEGGFAKFDTPANGTRAHQKLIANQIRNGFDTPLAWAQHYAPAFDGNDPQAYAATVASGLGIGINDKIPLSAVPKMAALSARVEAGGTPAPAGGATAPRTGGPRQLDSTPFAQKPNGDLSGDQFLASLPVARQNFLKAIADGRVAAPKPGSKFGEQTAQDAANAFPGIDTTTFPARVQARKDFTGNGKGAQNVSALNRFYAHLNDAYDIHLRLGGKNLGPLSGIAAHVSQAFSPKDVNDYDVAIEGLQGEFQKLTKNGQGNESEAQRLIAAAKAAQSADGRLGALQALAKLAAAQVEPLHDQWTAAFPERPIPIDITPASRAIYQNVVGGGSHAIAIDKNGTPVVPKTYKPGASATATNLPPSVAAALKKYGH